MNYEQRLIDRYKGVHALAEGGAPGERDNARSIRDKMRSQHPGIHEEAFPPPPPPPGTPFDPFSSWRTAHETQSEPEPEPDMPRGGRSGFWDGIRWQDMAGDVLGWAARAAQEMSSLGTARAYAESTVEVQAKVLPSHKWQVSARIGLRDLYAVGGEMNEAQRVEFSRYVAAMVEAEVMRALEEASGA
jgi:hypothetical protein